MFLATRLFSCFLLLAVSLFLPVTAHAATHTVLPDDSLYAISQRYGVTVASLVEANGVKDHLIFPGQQLNIPAGSPLKAGSVYIVQLGDSLFQIAQKYDLSYQEIMSANNLKSTDIYPGTALYVPGAGGDEPAPQPGLPVSRSLNFIRPSPDDVDLLARLITAEADSEPYAGKVGVGAVVLNRVTSPGFPKSIKDVIYQTGSGIYQFEPVENGWINRPASEEAKLAAREALGGVDPTNGATYFFATKSKSAWLWGRPVSTQIGNTIFSY